MWLFSCYNPDLAKWYLDGSERHTGLDGTTGKVNFYVGAPEINIMSLENVTYNSSSIPLNFIVNRQFSKVAYCIDNQNFTISGNTTLSGLSNGFS